VVAAGANDGVALLTDQAGRQLKDAHPDVAVRLADGRTWILDAKYRSSLSEVGEPELYQLMAHATAYGAERAALIVPETTQNVGIRSLGSDRLGTSYDVIAVDPTDAAALRLGVAAWLDD
jgi:5-methylcytosine-specific restriction endonuclease McrBC regulatory subunit McrC